MNVLPLTAVLFGAVLALVGCASPLRVTGIPIAHGATFDLLPPASFGQEIALEQIVEAKYGDKEFSFRCLLEVDRERLVLVGMTPFNTRAFTLTLKEEELSIDVAPGAQLPADPSRILADLQLALWPNPRVQGLEWSEGFLREVETDSPVWTRAFFRNSTRVITITYLQHDPRVSSLTLENHEQDYVLEVRTVRAEKLSP